MESGLSKLIKEASSNDNCKNVREKLCNLANIFLNSNLMSSQEADYHVLSRLLSKSSSGSIFINTSQSSERVLMLKPKS